MVIILIICTIYPPTILRSGDIVDKAKNEHSFMLYLILSHPTEVAADAALLRISTLEPEMCGPI